jgi:hypothetical protein
MTESEIDKCIHANGVSGVLVVEFSDGRTIDGMIFKFSGLMFAVQDTEPVFEPGFYFLKTDDLIEFQKKANHGFQVTKTMMKFFPEQVKKIMSRDEYHQKKQNT